MDELAAADVHSNVRDSAARGVEEDQVARLEALVRHRFSGVILLRRGPRKRYALPAIDVLGKARTVESARSQLAPPIRRAAVGEGRPYHVVCGGRGFCLRPDVMRVVPALGMAHRRPLRMALAVFQLDLKAVQVIRQRLILMVAEPVGYQGAIGVLPMLAGLFDLQSVQIVSERLVLVMAQSVRGGLAMRMIGCQLGVFVPMLSRQFLLLAVQVVCQRFVLMMAELMHYRMALRVRRVAARWLALW